MRKMRDFNAAIEALNKLQTNFSVLEEINKLGTPARDEDLVPEMIEWVRRVGYSPKDFDKMNVLHITGTKGKGSTSAFTQSILLQYEKSTKAAEVGKIGLYTSPHIKSVRERVMINGEPISAEKFAEYFFQVYDKLDGTSSDTNRFPRMGAGIKPNYFRFLTLVSFHAFMSEGVKSAIYEVGIGGEYDSTNVFVQPKGTAVTSLGIDHVKVLGDTIEKIAWNKAGIFKSKVPAFTIDDQPKSALAVLEDRAKEKGTELTVVPVHPTIAHANLGLKGEFQRKNATIAAQLVAARLGIDLSGHSLPDLFVEGLANAQLAGRCQTLERRNATWYLDGAHTQESLAEAVAWFAGARKTPHNPNGYVLVFNQQKRDNVLELLQNFSAELQKFKIPIAEAYFSTNQSWAKGFQADMISHNVSKEQVDKLTIQKSLADEWIKLNPNSKAHVAASLEEVVDSISPDQEVFATGSLLMVGGLLAVIDP